MECCSDGQLCTSAPSQRWAMKEAEFKCHSRGSKYPEMCKNSNIHIDSGAWTHSPAFKWCPGSHGSLFPELGQEVLAADCWRFVVIFTKRVTAVTVSWWPRARDQGSGCQICYYVHIWKDWELFKSIWQQESSFPAAISVLPLLSFFPPYLKILPSK